MTTETRLSAPSTGRPAARQILFAALSESGSLSRADLARRTGLAASTVSTVTAELIRDGLVGELDRGDDSDRGARSGRPPTLLALNRSAGLVIGIDFGKQHLRVAVADRSHDLVAERVRRVAPERRASTDVRWAVRLVHDALDEAGAGIDDVVGIGMGLPGPIHGASGEVGDSTILPGWVGVPAAEAMSEALEHPVLVENDANLGALSEWMWGAARGVSEVVYVKAATGIGAGLIVNGQPYTGAGGTAGELGHVVVDPGGPICRCGNRGCLEMVAGAPAVIGALQQTHGDLVVADVLRLARSGDTGCRRALADAGRHIGSALAMLCNLVNPARVVVGGELGAAGDLLLAPMEVELRRGAIRSASQDVELVQGSLGERAEVLGAVALALTRRPLQA